MKDPSLSARLAMQEQNVEVQEARRCRGNVRRRLFVDESVEPRQNANPPDNARQFHEEYLEFRRRELEEAKQRWNFDFEEETPLPGKYTWVKVEKTEECGARGTNGNEGKDERINKAGSGAV